MRADNVEYIVVTVGNGRQGVLTLGDMVSECMVEGHDPLQCQVRQHAQTVAHSGNPDMRIGDAAVLMMNLGVNHLPVEEKGKVVGLLLLEDVSAALDHMLMAEVMDADRDRWEADAPV